MMQEFTCPMWWAKATRNIGVLKADIECAKAQEPAKKVKQQHLILSTEL